MRNFLCAIIFLGLFLLSSSCNHYHYVPNNMVMPAIEKQHDATISIAVSDYGGREIQAVYSPLKHVAMMYNDLKITASSDEKNSGEWGQGRLQEGGIGAYYGKSPWSLSLFGGYGQGFAENSFGVVAGSGIKSRLDFQQYFIQPGFVLQTGGLRFGMAMRQVWLRYNGGDVDVDNMPDEEFRAIRSIEQNSPFGITEFGLTLGFRLRPFTFTYNSVSLFGEESYYEFLRFAPNNYNFMLTLDLYELWRWDDTPPRRKKNR
jgi:hypothetical protein